MELTPESNTYSQGSSKQTYLLGMAHWLPTYWWGCMLRCCRILDRRRSPRHWMCQSLNFQKVRLSSYRALI